MQDASEAVNFTPKKTPGFDPTGLDPDDWMWCLHCHRVFQAKDLKVDQVGNHQGCAFLELSDVSLVSWTDNGGNDRHEEVAGPAVRADFAWKGDDVRVYTPDVEGSCGGSGLGMDIRCYGDGFLDPEKIPLPSTLEKGQKVPIVYADLDDEDDYDEDDDAWSA